MALPSRVLLGGALLAIPLLFSCVAEAQSYNGLAVTPAMGWDNWNAFGCAVSEDLLLGTAQKIVDLGLRDLGYRYVVLDDCWSVGRYDNGSLRPDFTKFPNGMKHVGDKLHAMGLKFGMYSSAGYLTCGKYAASLGRETIDAQSFASWGVDYLKYDNCYNGGQAGTQSLSYTRYNVMSQALNATGRPILYSLCNWGEDQPWNWAQTMSNSWRMSGDVYDSFSRPDARCPCSGDETVCALPGFHCSVLNIMNKMASIVSKTQSGAQSDMDMLEVGNGGMTDDEYKTHFSIWALNASPLLMGTDIRALTPSALSIYSNAAVIAINQDPLVSAGVRQWRYYVNDTDEHGMGEIALWTRFLSNNDIAVALVNAGNSPRTMNATLADIFIDLGAGRSTAAQMEWDVYDLWANRMDNVTAEAILNGMAGPVAGSNSTARYNATATSYAEGLANNSTALLGVKVGSVPPLGTLTATVPRHGVGFFRLRLRHPLMRRRDEL